jgi:hypothetical protein
MAARYVLVEIEGDFGWDWGAEDGPAPWVQSLLREKWQTRLVSATEIPRPLGYWPQKTAAADG